MEDENIDMELFPLPSAHTSLCVPKRTVEYAACFQKTVLRRIFGPKRDEVTPIKVAARFKI
jgi:hypothetical protein